MGSIWPVRGGHVAEARGAAACRAQHAATARGTRRAGPGRQWPATPRAAGRRRGFCGGTRGRGGRPIAGMGSPQVSTGGGAAACETGRANSGERKRLEDNATQTQQLGRLAAAGRS
jgi:hypothetical protein